MILRIVSLTLIFSLSALVPLASGADGKVAKTATPAKAASAKAKSDSKDTKDAKGGDAAASSEPEDTVPAKPTKSRKPPKIKVEPIEIAVIAEQGRRKTLSIDYRWKIHEKASVEVRLVPAERVAQGATAVPVCFVGENVKGKVTEQIFKCLDHAGDRMTTESFTKHRMIYKIIGDRNSLGRPAVYVLPYHETGTVADRPCAVFLQLDCWAVNDHLLALDLPREAFASPGVLFVWFLRDDKVVWEDKVDWPGY